MQKKIIKISFISEILNWKKIVFKLFKKPGGNYTKIIDRDFYLPNLVPPLRNFQLQFKSEQYKLNKNMEDTTKKNRIKKKKIKKKNFN